MTSALLRQSFDSEDMRVAFDARFALASSRRGIGNYSLGLLKKLIPLLADHEVILYTDARYDEAAIPEFIASRVRIIGLPFYPWWEQVSLPLALSNDRVDVFHALGNTAPLCMPSGVKLVLTLHDVMFLKSGVDIPSPANAYQRFGKIYRALVCPVVARKADVVLTVSEFSKGDIIGSIKGVDEAKVVVTYQSCSFSLDEELIQHKLKATSRTLNILLFGAVDLRKNTKGFIEAFLRFCEGSDAEHTLTIVGLPNKADAHASASFQRHPHFCRLQFFEYVSSSELKKLFARCDVLAYPSFYEGFGIPVLEGFATGCVVLASNAASIPEVGGDAAVFFNPHDKLEMSRAMILLHENSSLQSDLRLKGIERYKHFSWESVASRTLASYGLTMK
jgi:glycosyltransferase involved in cell wall biosynthesis